MSKYTTIFAVIAGLVLAIAPAAQAGLLDWTSSIDGPYRIAFMSDGTYTATSTDITWYNGNVAGEAAAETELNALGATWNCIGSTAAVSARANTGTYTLALDGAGLYDAASDVPIYTVGGVLVATGNTDLWDGSIAVAIAHRDGTPIIPAVDPTWDYHRAWTGTTTNGSIMTSGDGLYLGHATTYVRAVRGGETNSQWIGADSDWPSASKRLMALSDPIPEPATMSLLAIGGLGVLLRRRSLRR